MQSLAYSAITDFQCSLEKEEKVNVKKKKKRDIDELIGHAVRQGFEFEYQPSGHWKATSPYDGKVTKISSTPRSSRGVKDARAKLKRIGYKPILPPKRKEKKMVLKVVKPTPIEKAIDMPKLGEMATLRTAMTTDEASKDIILASYVIWQAIHTRLKADSSIPYEGRSKPMAGLKGKVWAGSRTHLLKDMWPDIERKDITRIGQYLSGSKNMATLVRGRGGMESIWWISDEFTETTKYQAQRTPVQWWKDEEESTKTGHPRVTNEDLEVKVSKPKQNTRERGKFAFTFPDEDGYYRCPMCNYATKNLGSLSPHIGRLGDQSHPNDGEFKCKFCDDIFPTTIQLSNHHTRRHHKTSGQYYCRKCNGYYVGNPYMHRAVHTTGKALDETHLKVDQGSDIDNEPTNTPEVVETPSEESQYVVTPRSAIKDGKVINAEVAIRQVLDELGSLRMQNDVLRTEARELEDENRNLREKMKANEEFVESIRKQLLR